MEWHHPDSGICAYDTEARRRYTQFLKDINTELLTQYGKIDILWYDVPAPMESWEGWDSLERNQYLRSLQPNIIINDRSCLAEDFGTPEEQIKPSERDWEACMTFNGISWGYVDSDQALPYSYTPQRIVNMLQTCCEFGGNLLLNVGRSPTVRFPMRLLSRFARSASGSSSTARLFTEYLTRVFTTNTSSTPFREAHQRVRIFICGTKSGLRTREN